MYANSKPHDVAGNPQNEEIKIHNSYEHRKKKHTRSKYFLMFTTEPDVDVKAEC